MGLSSLSNVSISRFEHLRSDNCKIVDDQYILPGLRICLNSTIHESQNGPKCGLVALKMAGSLLELEEKSVDEIFSIASTAGYTKQGEMFSVSYLANVFHILWPGNSAIVGEFPDQQQIASLIAAKSAILIPYDCDRNHEPTNLKGHKAHWAIIVGFAYLVFDSEDIEETTVLPEKGTRLYLLCYHGKSRHIAIWDYETVRQSNSQLLEIGDKRENGDFVVPIEGPDLASKCLILSKSP